MLHLPTVRACLATLVVAVCLIPAGWARGQCGPRWLPGESLQAVNGVVNATLMWDPDGSGPQTPKLVVGGSFTVAGGVFANNIAMYDLEAGTWSSLGAGVGGGGGGAVFALATLPNGNLVVGGNFSTAGGVGNINGVARWNGSSWSAFGLGTSGPVRALAVLSNGNLVAGGDFNMAGGNLAVGVARWSGTSWSAMGSGLSGRVNALTVLPSGDLVAGGQFFTAGNATVNNIARWNGVAWSALGDGFNASVRALAVLPNGDLIAGGEFTTIGSLTVANRVARWNGSAWFPLSSGGFTGISGGIVTALVVRPSGHLIAAGTFTGAGSVGANRVARWDGSAWFALGSGPPGVISVSTLTNLPDGDLAADLSRWNRVSWSDLTRPGWNGQVRALAEARSGELIAAGAFSYAGATPVQNIARWDGAAWSPLGTGLNSVVFALAVLRNGDLVAGGFFSSAGSVPVNRVARWDGSAWSELGSGVGVVGDVSQVNALVVLPNGDLVAGGRFTVAGGAPANYVARWNGSSWSPLGTGLNNIVDSLAVMPNGDLIVGGEFTTAGGVPANRIARWDGFSWWALGSGMNNGSVRALAVLPNGNLVAGGFFQTAGGVQVQNIALWDGNAWGFLANGGVDGEVRSIAVLPSGGLVVTGGFSSVGAGFGQVQARGIARWNGAAWSALGTGLEGAGLALLPRGANEIAVGGQIAAAGGVISGNVARYSFGGAPSIAVQPAPRTLDAGQTATLSATPARGLTAVSVQWFRNGSAVSNGPRGASVFGGTVTGASATLPSPTSGAPAFLTITNAQPSDSGSYTAAFTNACGAVTSAPALLTVNVTGPPPCPGSGPGACGPGDWNEDGGVDFNDLLAFYNDYNAQTPCSDVTGDGVTDFNDLLEFLNRYNPGC